ncbi:MAG: AarF/ABC1/UbiB kinase family protein, partial [Lysobacter sp.]|nr:AarF/ABC1/UbiB kinase family protein [Lysobacter sp.]
MKYRNSGVFTGLDWNSATDMDPATLDEGQPADFVRDLEALGPTFIKIGQALSTRPDMVPPAYLAALERMQDDVTAVDSATIEAVIEAELGVRLHSVFPEFDPTPLGCASLAQVHRAVLRDGREVAVKVQRPGVAQNIRSDLDTLQMLASKADHATQVGKRLHFADWVQEFRKTLLDELDYRLEADHLERFGDHLARYPTLIVPQPLRDLSSA